MLDDRTRPAPLATLAIGSAPFGSPAEAIDLMAAHLDIPAHPQMVRITAWEDMLLSGSSGFPAMASDAGQNLLVARAGREEALADFYERSMAGDLEFLALDPRSSAGFEAFMARAQSDPGFGPDFLKSQVVGPLTFGQSVKVEGAHSLVDDPELLAAAALALGGKAAWLAGRIRAAGRFPVVFLDEPGLTGYGSAFSTLTSDTVVGTLSEAVEAARSGGPVLVGCHVCGNTDWGLLTKVGLDVINFDAWEYQDTVRLYPKEIRAFLEGGGLLAWGVVPTRDFGPSVTADRLAAMIREGWEALARKGPDLALVKERTLLTSACGLGRLTVEQARGILSILPEVARILRPELDA
jgi:hypothetical protein